MYSYEIEQLLHEREFIINIEDYKRIIASSQICFIKYDPWDDSFIINTEDRYSWRFRVVNTD